MFSFNQRMICELYWSEFGDLTSVVKVSTNRFMEKMSPGYWTVSKGVI